MLIARNYTQSGEYIMSSTAQSSPNSSPLRLGMMPSIPPIPKRFSPSYLLFVSIGFLFGILCSNLFQGISDVGSIARFEQVDNMIQSTDHSMMPVSNNKNHFIYMASTSSSGHTSEVTPGFHYSSSVYSDGRETTMTSKISQTKLNDRSSTDMEEAVIDTATTVESEIGNDTSRKGLPRKAGPFDGTKKFEDTSLPTNKLEEQSSSYLSEMNVDGNDVQLVIGVLSAVSNFDRRQAVRDTWFRYAGGAGKAKWVGIFIVGYSPKRHEAALQVEMDTYNDIVIAQVTDTYQSLTIKVLALMNYAAENAANAFVLKTDDDTFVAVDRVLEALEKAPPSCFYLGAQQKLNEQLTWDPNNKWYVPPDEFPFGQNVLYMQGGAYVLSSDLAKGINDVSSEPSFTLPFPSAGFLEDASIGVLLAQNGMQWTCRHSDFRFSGRRPYGNGYCTDENLITYHHVDQGTMRKMHIAYMNMLPKADKIEINNVEKTDEGTVTGDVLGLMSNPLSNNNMTLCEVVEAANLEEQDLLGDMKVISDASGPLIFADGLRNLIGGNGLSKSMDMGGNLQTKANLNLEHGADEQNIAENTNSGSGNMVESDAASISLQALRREFAIQAGIKTRTQPDMNKLTAFTMVAIKTEIQQRYLLEWIDFHMLQGVDKFVLYDNSDDNSGALEALVFEYLDVKVVEVIRWPATWDEPEIVERRQFIDEKDKRYFNFIMSKCVGGINETTWFTPDGTEYERQGDMFPYECQLGMYMDAFAAYRQTSEWIFPFDIDEYMYAPKDPTLLHYLRTLPSFITAMEVQCASFGSSGKLEPPPLDSDVWLIEEHTHRAPYIRFGEDEENIRKMKAGCENVIPGSEWPVCETGPGKSIIRGIAAKPSNVNIHSSQPSFGERVGGGTSMDILCNHYVFPSKKEMDERRYIHKYAYEFADDYYNTVTDDVLVTEMLPVLKLLREVRKFSGSEQFQG